MDCWHKFESARTMAFRLSASMVNFAADQMDEASGLPPNGARIVLPPIPRGPMILNNIKVDNSVVGSINTGNVRTIDVTLTHLHNAGNDKVGNGLKALTEAILSDQTLSKSQKNELVEQVAFISEQTVMAAKDRKPGIIKAALSAIAQTAGTISAVSTAWNAVEPILKNQFGF